MNYVFYTMRPVLLTPEKLFHAVYIYMERTYIYHEPESFFQGFPCPGRYALFMDLKTEELIGGI